MVTTSRLHRGFWVVVALVGLAGAAQAQAPLRTPPVPLPGQPTLQPEPGDFWADVKAWNEQARRRVNRGGGREPTSQAAPRPTAPRRPVERRPRPPAADPG